MMKRIVCLLLCVMMLVSMCLPAFAAENKQVVSVGGTNSESQAYATVSKTIEETGRENEFKITLSVETPINVEEIVIEESAAVTIVIDNSGSMGSNETVTTSRLYRAKAAAKNFVNEFAKVTSNDVHRYVSVVVYNDSARILADGAQANKTKYWIDVANTNAADKDSDNETLVKSLIDGIKSAKNSGDTTGTNTEAGLQLALNLYDSQDGFWNAANVKGNGKGSWSNIKDSLGKITILLTDGVPITYIADGVEKTGKNQLVADEEEDGVWTRDDCYKETRYVEDVYEKNSDGNYVLEKNADDMTSQEKTGSKHAPYRATQRMIARAKELIKEDVAVYGIAVGLDNIYVEKAYPHNPKNIADDAWKWSKHAYVHAQENAVYYYVNTVDWMEGWLGKGRAAVVNNTSVALKEAFTAVLDKEVATWKATDELPAYVVLSGDNDSAEKSATWNTGRDTLTWDLRNDSTVKKENGKYKFSYAYNVTLDPTKMTETDINSDGSINTNKVATLKANTQAGVNNDQPDVEIEFPHPTIKTDPATITIIKIDDVTQKPLPNAKFRLVGKTAGYNGDDNFIQEKVTQIVTENGVQSAKASFQVLGGTHTLKEVGLGADSETIESGVPEGYEENNTSWEFEVEFGKIKTKPADFTLSNESHAVKTLANTRKTGSLTISKKEGSSVVNAYIDRDKAFEFDILLETETYYGSGSYVNLAGKEYTAVLTDRNNPTDTGTTANITIKTNANGKVYVQKSEEETAPLTLGLDDAIVINGLPVGTRFTITETPDTNYDLTEVKLDGETLASTEESYTGIIMLDDAETTRNESAPAIEFTNTRKTGSIKVSKDTIGTSHDPEKEFQFEIIVRGGETYPGAKLKTGAYGAVSFPDGEKGSFKLAKGEDVVIRGLPVGFEYEVVELLGEDAKDYLSELSGEAEKIIVADDKKPADADEDWTPTPKKTETFTNIRRSGSLIIRKLVEGNGAANGKLFTFKIELSDTSIHTDTSVSDVPVNGTDITVTKYKGDAETGTPLTDVLFNQGVAYVELAHDECVVIDHLPTETEAEERELSDAEVRALETGTDTLDDSVDPDAPEKTEEEILEELKQIEDYGKLGYADYQVLANGVEGVSVTGEIVEDGEGVTPMTALFTNIRRVGDLTIIKNVEEAGDRKGIFDFELTVESDVIAPEKINGEYGDLWFLNGVAKFQLKHQESVTAKELPAGAKFTIVESDPKGHIQSGDEPAGVIVEGDNVQVRIVNWLPFLPLTGDNSRLGLMFLLLLGSTIGLVALRKRKHQ